MRNQLWLRFSFRPESAARATVRTATGKDLDAIANSFGLFRRGATWTNGEGADESDAELRRRTIIVLETYYPTG